MCSIDLLLCNSHEEPKLASHFVQKENICQQTEKLKRKPRRKKTEKNIDLSAQTITFKIQGIHTYKDAAKWFEVVKRESTQLEPNMERYTSTFTVQDIAPMKTLTSMLKIALHHERRNKLK